MAVLHTNLRQYLPLVASGKVREIYDLEDGTLLFVATDRISAYDVIMKNGIDQKGAILTSLSAFWFDLLANGVPGSPPKIRGLQTHFVSLDLPSKLQRTLPPDLVAQLRGRSMVVRRLKVVPIESIVRGYIAGSAWASYQQTGAVCDIQMPPHLRESQKLDRPLWTPSTKAQIGDVDENVSPERGKISIVKCRTSPVSFISPQPPTNKVLTGSNMAAATIIGKEIADRIEDLSIQIYTTASEYAAQRGIILADTKFEFGLDESAIPPAVVLIDEVLTPDSSRFWAADRYRVGQGQESFDKQYLRDWLVQTGQKGKEGVEMPQEVIENTLSKYKEAFHRLAGKQWL